MATTPTLNGKRQIIEFPESKLVYFIPFFDYGKDLRCDLTNKCFSWILAIREIFFCTKTNLILNSRKFFLWSVFQKKRMFLVKILRSLGTRKFLSLKYCRHKKQNTDFFQNTSFKELKNMTAEKNLSLTINFYRKLCLAVISWNKKYLSKQVGAKHTHWRNSFWQLLVLKVCELFHFRQSKKIVLYFGL